MNIDKKELENKTDEEIIELIIHNQSYFYVIIERYEKKLLNYIFRISDMTQEEAEDILQEVFIKVYLYINDFDKNLKFSSWIYRITHNLVIDKVRKEKFIVKINSEDKNKIIEKIKDDFNIEKEIDNTLLKQNIDKIFSEMDKKYKDILELKYLEDKDYNEISDILSKPIGTVGTLINRAKKQFRQIAKNKNLNI
ncbi:MAG TPA: RNA polymerase sigma factor [bacterium]|nr:RNA polymerase sigma factor [Patescibacteria group bacterium]HPO11269.1 RNA polymerase sigma factor [bacterium]HQL12303.1 RNA polymerase sigma factor [bacterium]